MSSFLILALASSALAVPFGHSFDHFKLRQENHFHHSGHVGPTGSGAPYPYPVANATGYWGSTAGTAAWSTPAVSSTVTPDPLTEAAAAATEPISSTSCTESTTYVTETNRVTMTIYQTNTATDSAEESYATMSLYKKGFNGNNKQRWRKSSSVSSSASSAVVTSTVKTSAVVTSTVTSSAEATSTSASVSVTTSSSVVVASSKTSSSAASQTTASSSGKRGVAYNDASLTTPFEGASEVTWGYNWGQSSSGLSSSFNYVPLLWGASSSFTDGWASTVAGAAALGVTHLMSFNEPDLSSQADLTPAAAAAAYKTYMQPYAGQFKLGAPAVTNGGGSMGLDWLAAFLEECSGCTIDFVAAHWYDSPTNTAYFEEHVANVSTVAGGKPVWLTEFGVTSGTDAQISTFLETVMPWMDSQDYVERYAYFMVADGLLVNDGTTSDYGSTYMSYTGSS